MSVWAEEAPRRVLTVIYIYGLPTHLGGCYPGGLCWSSHTFFQLEYTVADFDSAIEVVSHVLLDS